VRVCVIRNSQAESNAGLMRVIDALLDNNVDPIILSRTRFNRVNKGEYIHKSFKYKKHIITNYELQLESEMGKGISNIYKLIAFQWLTLTFLLKNRRKFDVIHAFDLDAGIPALVISLFFRKKLIYHIADFYIDSRPGIPHFFKNAIRRLDYFIISKANATIICTEERKKQIEKSKPRKLYVIHNSPVDQCISNGESSRRKREDEENKDTLFSITYVGGLTEVRFIREALETIKKYPNIRLNIAGYGPLDSIVEETSENFSNIKYHGRIDYADALNLYSNCDLMFAIYDPRVPNHRYSAPNKVYEAMMLGKAIIVSEGTGIDKLVEKENMGFVIKYDEKSFEKILDYIIEDKKRLEVMKKNAKNAYNMYSWEKMKKRIHEVYNNI